MSVTTTPRLRLERFGEDDAAFILRLVNEPAWLHYIGDKGVRTLEDARGYLRNGPMAMYERHGHGLYRIDHAGSGTPIGMCGLIKRDNLADVDIGYALLPEHCGQGYAEEAARATLQLARERFGLRRVVAIVTPGNARSTQLLLKLGMRYERNIEMLPGNAPELYAVQW